jgi:hypothetical protein
MLSVHDFRVETHQAVAYGSLTERHYLPTCCGEGMRMLKRKYEKPALKAKGLLSAVTAAGPITLIEANGGDPNGAIGQ